MGLRISTNIPVLASQRAMNQTSRETEKAMKQLSSGNRYADVSEGAADFAIGERLRAQGRGMQAASDNAQMAQSFIGVAEGGLNEQNNLLIRMRELAVQAASDTYSDKEREMINVEFQQLQQEVDRIAKTTTFGSQKLLSGESKTYQFQVGPNHDETNVISYNSKADTTANNLGIKGTDVLDADSAQDTLESVDEALEKIGSARASFGAIDQRLNSVVNSTQDQVIALEQARSNVEDTDVATAYATMVRGQALQQYQLSVMNEANRNVSNLLKLVA